jgi:penicillin-binding protein 1A
VTPPGPRGPGPPDPPSYRRRRARRRRRSRGLIVLAVLLGIPLVLLAVGVGGAAVFQATCDLGTLKPVTVGQNSFIYAADGTLLGSIPADQNRQPVALAAVSPFVRNATVAVEDRRFYEHGGIDYMGIARAFWSDVRAGHIVQGGSTITQQLVRNLYIGNQRTLGRKLTEACLAIKLSRHWSKDKILEAYLNQVYYGNHAYGIEAAAQTYFSEPASALSLDQSALLAGLPQAPSDFDPFHRPQDALERRDQVLRAMVVNDDITQAQYAAAVADRKLHLKPGSYYTRIREPYFFGYVLDQLIQEYGTNVVREGGLNVVTTIDPRLQRAAREAIHQTLNLPTDPASAIVSIDPRTGAIRAMEAVTPGRKGNQFNLVAQARRQAGSTFKTFVLTQAVLEGINPASTSYVSAPFHYQPDPSSPAWDVSTYDHTYVGWISIERATLRSDNTVYAQLTLDVGPEKVAALAHRMGVTSPLLALPSIGLGAMAISPLDLASGYATIASGGIYSKPMAILKVTFPDGTVDRSSGWGQPDRHRVIPDWVAAEVTRILEENVQYGTGIGAYFGRPAAGKTGTTDNHADAWFSGFTPTLQTTVWVGYPGAEIPMENVHGIAVAGGTFPATIWRLYMEKAVGGLPPVDFRPASHAPVWKPFTRGPYDLSYAPSTSTTTTTTGTTTGATTTALPTTTAPVAPAPPPTTAPVPVSQPPPPTTTAPPPTTTTIPIPPSPAPTG